MVITVLMYLTFYIGEKALGIYENEYPLGELTAEILDISPDDYQEMRELYYKAKADMCIYKYLQRMDMWDRGNEKMIRLSEMLSHYRAIKVIQSDSKVFSDTKLFIAQRPDPEESDLISPGSLEFKWAAYEACCMWYERILHDIAAVCPALRKFVREEIPEMDKLTPSTYLEALSDYLFSENSYLYIPHPFNSDSGYTYSDPVFLRLIPRETTPGSGVFKVYEYYETTSLQAMLKLDFYKALEAGHLIRRCEYCGRHFLLRKGYHTKYCDRPNPDNPKYTCAQLGYSMRGIKEGAEDSPLTQALYRCFQRIDKDKTRGAITAEEREVLREKAKELYHEARVTAGTTYAAFNESLSKENLYPLCGVQRRSKPRGRPRKEN